MELKLKEQSQILGLITINGINSIYVKYSCAQIIRLMKYFELQDNAKNIAIYGYGNIGGNKKVIIFPKNSVVSYSYVE